jgi:hypothetical protein
LTGNWTVIEIVIDGVDETQNTNGYIGSTSIEGLTEEVGFHEKGRLTHEFNGEKLSRDSSWYEVHNDSLTVLTKRICLDGYCYDTATSHITIHGDTLTLITSNSNWSKYLRKK